MKQIFLVFFFICCTLGFSKNEYKYGKVTTEDLSEKTYKKDSLTGAVVIYSIGEIKEGVFTKREKIKIYDKNALSLANQTIILYNPKFSSSDAILLNNIKGKTYNIEDGKIVESDLTKKSVRIDKLDDYHDIVHFAFTNVKEGSIIEYEIQLTNVGIPTWYFQQYYPVEYSEFTVELPEFYKLRRNIKGYLTIPYPEENDQSKAYYFHGNAYTYTIKSNTWKMKDIPAFVREPFMYCEDNYISQINHELLSIQYPGGMENAYSNNWSEILKNLLDNPYHGQILGNSSGFMNIEYNKVKDINNNLQRLDACYKLIQNKMSWNGVNSIYSLDIKDAYKETKGSVADINFLLLRLLKDCNIQSYPVILSTRENGFVPMFPSFNKFNYMIVLAKVNGQTFLLDATDKFLPINMLPKRCLNNKGLVVKEGAIIEWVDLNTKNNANTIISIDAKLSEEGNLKGKATLKKSNYAALDTRNLTPNSRQEAILKNAANAIEISNYTITNTDSVHLPIVENFDFLINNNDSKNAATLLIEPALFEQIKENPFKSPTRTYPVELSTPIEKIYVVNISLPTNFTVDELPKNISITMPDNSAKFSYQLSVINNTIQLIAKLSIKNILYSQDQYPDLREFYAQFISKLSEPILLQRK